MYPDDLQHWGIKGMKWGQRRYQNKDGSLTPAGQKRYNKELENLKKEEAKVKEQAKIAANRKKTQAKIDSLEERKKALAEQKKKIKDGDDPDNKKKEETLDEKRERLLKSTDAKELYKNKDILTDQEINARINRIDLEARLNSKIVKEQEMTGRDKVNKWMDNTAESINKATNLYRKVDDAYSTVTKSAIGKTLAKKLGLEPEEKTWDWKDFAKNINKKSSQEIAEASKRAINEKNIKKHVEGIEEAEEAARTAKKAEKQAAENLKKAQKEVDDYNEKWQRGETDNKNTTYSKKGSDLNNRGKDDISDGRKYEVAIYDSGKTYTTTSPAVNRSTSSYDSDTINSGKSYTEKSDILEGKIVTDSDGNVRIVYDDDVRHSSIESDELMHYGVKGMKWGVRKRYIDERFDNTVIKKPPSIVTSKGTNRGKVLDEMNNDILSRKVTETFNKATKTNDKKDWNEHYKTFIERGEKYSRKFAEATLKDMDVSNITNVDIKYIEKKLRELDDEKRDILSAQIYGYKE